MEGLGPEGELLPQGLRGLGQEGGPEEGPGGVEEGVDGATLQGRVAQGAGGLEVGEVERVEGVRGPGRVEAGPQGLGPVGVAAVGQAEGPPVAGQGLGQASPEAARGPREEGPAGQGAQDVTSRKRLSASASLRPKASWRKCKKSSSSRLSSPSLAAQ